MDLFCTIGDQPWHLTRDFNEIFLPSEQIGCTFYSNKATKYVEVIENYGVFSCIHMDHPSLGLEKNI